MMTLDPTTRYCILGFLTLVVGSILYLMVSASKAYQSLSKAIKSLRITRRVLFILGGLFLIMMGVDFLENPVRFGTRAQYDLRGWLKYVAAAACFYPGAYAVIVGLTPSSWDRKSKDD